MSHVENLSQLKRVLQKGARFKVLDHFQTQLIGQIREVNVVQSNAIYTVIADNPQHEWSQYNGGKGGRLDFAKASFYDFSSGTIKQFKRKFGTDEKDFVMEFQII